MNKIFSLLLLGTLLSCSVSPVRSSIREQLGEYPESRAQDIYKSFCQDYLGPEHLIPDPEAARAYLQSELAEYRADLEAGRYKVPAQRFHFTGDRKNFVRVDLSVVLDGLISADALLDAFVRSANQGPKMTVGEWETSWQSVAGTLRRDFSRIPDLERDLQQIDSLMAGGHYILHHSPEYGEAYHPHYRIIERGIFNGLGL